VAGSILADEADNLSLQQAVELAQAGNPGLAEIKARAEALAAIPSQEGALPDPTLNFDTLNLPTNSFSLHKEDMTMMDVGISQTIPFPGKLALKEKVAEQEALAATDSIAVARLRLSRDVKQAWWRLFYYDRAITIIGESEAFFQQLLDSAQSRYRLGQGEQQDVLMAQLELSKLKDEKIELTGMRHSTAIQLNTLLSRGPETGIHLANQAEFKNPELTVADLQQQSMQSSPLFEQHRKMLDAAKTRIELAEQDFYPDLTVGAGYAVRQNTPSGQSRSDFASIRLSVNLPIYAEQKQAKAVDQRNSELLQEQYSLQDEHNKIHGEIATNTAQYRHAKERLNLLEHEIIPQSRQTVSSLLAGYPLGKANFADLLRTQLGLFQYQTQYWKSLVETQQLLAELSNLVGEELSHD
jgi:outer membrane protein TolC